MEKIIWTNRAKVSLHHIWHFYADINPEIADKIINEILEAANNIIYKEQYQREEILDKIYRKIIIRHFKIIYRPIENGILVLQVFDSRQDPDKLKI